MKRFLLAAGIAMTSTSVFAVGTSLETDAEKFSYAFGINFTQSMMRQGAPLDADAVYMAVKDALSGSDPRLSAEAMDTALRSAAQKAGEKKKALAGENLTKGKAFMDKNKAKKGVTTLPDGLQYEVLREGTGAQPTVDSTVKVHYTGKLVDGREFDSSKREGTPFLSTLPVLGGLFGSRSSENQRSNLIILVSANIVDPSGAHVGDEIEKLRDTARILLPPLDTISAGEMAGPELATTPAVTTPTPTGVSGPQVVPPNYRGNR